MRKSHVNNNIKLNEFDALIKITVEMSKYLYPYIERYLNLKKILKRIQLFGMILIKDLLSWLKRDLI